MELVHGNLLAALPDATNEERLEELSRGRSFRVERIVSGGQASPAGFWYDQEGDEWVLVLRGRTRLEIEDRAEPIELGPGDWTFLPAHLRHRVAWTAPDEPTIWLAVHAV